MHLDHHRRYLEWRLTFPQAATAEQQEPHLDILLDDLVLLLWAVDHLQVCSQRPVLLVSRVGQQLASWGAVCGIFQEILHADNGLVSGLQSAWLLGGAAAGPEEQTAHFLPGAAMNLQISQQFAVASNTSSDCRQGRLSGWRHSVCLWPRHFQHVGNDLSSLEALAQLVCKVGQQLAKGAHWLLPD